MTTKSPPPWTRHGRSTSSPKKANRSGTKPDRNVLPAPPAPRDLAIYCICLETQPHLINQISSRRLGNHHNSRNASHMTERQSHAIVFPMRPYGQIGSVPCHYIKNLMRSREDIQQVPGVAPNPRNGKSLVRPPSRYPIRKFCLIFDHLGGSLASNHVRFRLG